MPICVYRGPESELIAKDEGGEWRTLGIGFNTLFQSEAPLKRLGKALREGEPSTEIDRDGVIPPPIGDQEVWAAGVTYYRSRGARMEESESVGGDVFYDKVYEAERPELFFKATPSRVRGSGEEVCIRPDSSWDVPEPELTLAINSRGKVFGYTIGNDMSSRSIEGENPLYLPQAKVYRGSCALGPCLVVGSEPDSSTQISLQILRGGELVFSGEANVGQIKRGFDELAEFLFRANEFPHGAYLMTGTGIVPDSNFSLAAGDEIRIEIDGIGKLGNQVAVA